MTDLLFSSLSDADYLFTKNLFQFEVRMTLHGKNARVSLMTKVVLKLRVALYRDLYTKMTYSRFKYTIWDAHGLKSNRPNRVNQPFWQIDQANRSNSYLASHDLHSSLKNDKRFGAPVNCRFVSQPQGASPPIKVRCDEPWLLKIDLWLDHFC